MEPPSIDLPPFDEFKPEGIMVCGLSAALMLIIDISVTVISVYLC